MSSSRVTIKLIFIAVVALAGPLQKTPELRAQDGNFFTLTEQGTLERTSAPGGTPLHFHAMIGDADSLREDLAGVTDVNVRGDSQRTASMVAAANGNTDCLRLLLDAKADPDLRDENGKTALMLSVSRVVKGDTPGALPRQVGHRPSVELLLERGASLEIRDASGQTALDIARAGAEVEGGRWVDRDIIGLLSPNPSGGGSEAKRAQEIFSALQSGQNRHALDLVQQRIGEGGLSKDSLKNLWVLAARAHVAEDDYRSAFAAIQRARTFDRKDPHVAALELSLLTTANPQSDLAPRMAGELGKILGDYAKSNPEEARQVLEKVVYEDVDAEIIVPVFRQALSIVQRKQPARALVDGFVSGEVYREDFQNGAGYVQTALQAVSDGRWQDASDHFWKACVSVDSAREGYPLEATVLYPVIIGAQSAAELVTGDPSGARSSCSFALGKPVPPQLTMRLRTLSALATGLKGTALDRESGQPSNLDPSSVPVPGSGMINSYYNSFMHNQMWSHNY